MEINAPSLQILSPMPSRCRIYVPFSKVPLCKEHFLKNIEYRIRKTIDEFHLIDFKDPNEKIMVDSERRKRFGIVVNYVESCVTK